MPDDLTIPSALKLNSPGGSTAWTGRDWTLSLSLSVIVFGVYFQTHRFGFIDYDDQVYVYENRHLMGGFTGENLRRALTETVSSNWHPFTMLAELSVASLFGIHAGPFHLLNAILHAVNVALLFAFLKKAIGRFWPAAFAAALWGLHPLRVESVAWVSELKDVLCGTMWLLCMLAYLRYSRHRSFGRYIPVLILHALALLAKPMAVTLPATLLLLDVWPLRKDLLTEQPTKNWWTFRILEKLPLVLLSAAVIAYAIVTQRDTGSTQSLSRFPIAMRLENAVISVVAYLADLTYPRHLGLFYPHASLLAGGSISNSSVIGCVIILTIITVCVMFCARTKPYLPIGWLWFLGTLVPVIGLLQVGEQARADRYTYVPMMGVTIAVVWLVADVSATRPLLRNVIAVMGAALVGVFTISTFVYVGYWRNSTTLFTHADEVIPQNFLAKAILAYQDHLNGDAKNALRLSTEATQLAPTSVLPRLTYALALLDSGRYEEAARAAAMPTMTAECWYTLGLVRAAQAEQSAASDKPEAIAFRNSASDCFRRALRLDRNYSAAQDALAEQADLMLQHAHAIEIWTDLLNRSPMYSPAQGHLADALRVSGNIAEAIQHYRLAIEQGERNPQWQTHLAYLVATSPQATPREVQRLVAVATDARDQTNGKDPAAQQALAVCLARVGRFDDAITAAQACIDQAKLLHDSAMIEEAEKQLTLFRDGQPYIAD